MPQPKYIALFGYYKHGNFGDDLMAILFGQELKALGVPVRVYHLHPELLAEFELEGTESLDELLSDAGAVVYGGGGAFLRSNLPEFERTLDELCDACSERQIPLYLFSVGGVGVRSEYLSKARRKLLTTASYVTLRNAEDMCLTNDIGEDKCRVYHDVVWQTARHFPQREEKERNANFTIGIDATLLVRRRYRWAVYVLRTICRLFGKRYRFVCIAQSEKTRIIDGLDDTIRYTHRMRPFINAVSQMDAIVTPRLHLGMVAMSYNIPVFELFPHPKAKLLFSRIGLEHLLFPSAGSVLRLARLLLQEDAVRRLTPATQITELDNVVRDSAGHFEEMKRIVSCIENLAPH